MTEIEKCLGEHTERLDTLIGQVQHLAQLAGQIVAPTGSVQPLMAYTDAAAYGTNYDTPASPTSGKLRACIVTVNGGCLVQVFMRHASLPGGQLEMFHGYLAAGQPSNVIAASTHVPQGAFFRLLCTLQSGGTATSASIAAYVDPLPVTGPELFRTQRP